MIRKPLIYPLALLAGLICACHIAQASINYPPEPIAFPTDAGYPCTYLVNSDGTINLGVDIACLKAHWDNGQGGYYWAYNPDYNPIDKTGLIQPPLILGGGLLNSLVIGMQGDPSVTLNFSVVSGAVPTTFVINSAVVTVNLNNPLAFATAGLTLTDRDGDGASLTGNIGGKAYQALYNGGLTTFADLVSSFTDPINDTTTKSENKPNTLIPTFVNNMQSGFSFTASPNDGVSGTSFYSMVPVIIPESSGMLTLVLGGLALVAMSRKFSRV